MNIPLYSPACEIERFALRCDDAVAVREASGSPPNHGGPVPLWLKARAQTIDFQHADLVRTHWNKLWRSMVED